MEFSIRTAVVAIILVIIFVVVVTLITEWSGTGSSMIEGLSTFFEDILSGSPTPTIPDFQ